MLGVLSIRRLHLRPFQVLDKSQKKALLVPTILHKEEPPMADIQVGNLMIGTVTVDEKHIRGEGEPLIHLCSSH